jgi:hypothetical protein
LQVVLFERGESGLVYGEGIGSRRKLQELIDAIPVGLFRLGKTGGWAGKSYGGIWQDCALRIGNGSAKGSGGGLRLDERGERKSGEKQNDQYCTR